MSSPPQAQQNRERKTADAPGASPRSVRVAGVDGCRTGWVVMLGEGVSLSTLRLELRICTSFAEVLETVAGCAWVAVDLPIGLLEEPRRGGRHCDQDARRILGLRGCTVFSPPARPLLQFARYEELRAAVPRHGITVQCFHLFPKIREVDAIMNPGLQTWVREAHPELAFLRMRGAPVASKHGDAGRTQRQDLIRQAGPGFAQALNLGLARYPRRLFKPDDLEDALALVITAWHGAAGTGRRLPEVPEIDARGLAMEIWW